MMANTKVHSRNPTPDSGITAEELAEWKRLFQESPLNGTFYATEAGDVINFTYSMKKAQALRDFANAARTGWPRTVLELEALRRDQDEFRVKLKAAHRESYDWEEQARIELSGRNELSAQLDELRAMLRDNPTLSDMDAMQFEINSLRAQLDEAQETIETLSDEPLWGLLADERVKRAERWRDEFRVILERISKENLSLHTIKEMARSANESFPSIADLVEAYDPSRLAPATFLDGEDEDDD